MDILKDIQPELVWKYFKEISSVPRGSGNEKGICDYFENFAKENKLEYVRDKANNILIRKNASEGYEKAGGVILQGHMDMVCEKNNGVEHDFEKDPLKLRIVDDYIYATDTTLGADNGIAVAYAMAILASNDIPHPPIEVLLTTDEETGMSGAMAIKKENLQGKILINLDNEEEGYLLVSCAGGVRSTATLKVDEQEIGSKKLIKINISGLKGGHSGMDIIKERGNSNKILGRVLKGLLREVKFILVSLIGGSKNNAIPREAEAIIAVNPNDENTAIEVINNWNNIIENELRAQDPGLKSEASITDIKTCKEFTDESTKKVVDLLYIYPNGINTKSTEIEGLVESSTNLGVLTTKDGVVEFDSAIRSSIPSLKEEIVLRSKTIVELLGGKFETTSDYPGWEYDPNSKVRDICQKVHKDMYGKEAKIVAIHAGVECGLFNEKLGNLDMISFGPNLYDVHTPDEHMSISSVKNCYEYLLGILKEIR